MYYFGSKSNHRSYCRELSLTKAIARKSSGSFRSQSWIASRLSLTECFRSLTWLVRWSWDKCHPFPFVRKTPAYLASSHLLFLLIGPRKDALVRKVRCFQQYHCKVQRDLFLRFHLAKEKGSHEWSVGLKDPCLDRFCSTPSHGKGVLSLIQWILSFYLGQTLSTIGWPLIWWRPSLLGCLYGQAVSFSCQKWSVLSTNLTRNANQQRHAMTFNVLESPRRWSQSEYCYRHQNCQS